MPLPKAIRKYALNLSNTLGKISGEKSYDYSSLFLTGKELPYFGGSVSSAYENSWVAYSCIRRLAQDAAGIPLVFLNDPDDLESTVPDTHKAIGLFKKPIAGTNANELVQWLITILNLRGEYFIYFDNWMFPTKMIPYSDPLFWRERMNGIEIEGWEYRESAASFYATSETLIHHKLINPKKPTRGMPPIQSAKYALEIDTGADILQADIINRGGERSIIYEAPAEMTRQQREQALEQLRSRRGAKNQAGHDVLLPTGIKVIDPRFIEDDTSILQSQQMQPDKICAVYGLSKSLLGFEDIDKYATFQGRVRVYFTQTLIPMLQGIENSFDSFFANHPSKDLRCFVRFDFSDVPALQEAEEDKFRIAINTHAAGVPWTELNERFQLGLNTDNIPGANLVLANIGQLPIDELSTAWSQESAPQKTLGQQDQVSGEKISKTSKASPSSRLRRSIRLFKQERKLRDGWRKLITGAIKIAEDTAKEHGANSGIEQALAIKLEKLPDQARELVFTAYKRAAFEGFDSVRTAAEGEMKSDEVDDAFNSYQFDPAVYEQIANREKYIVTDIKNLNADVIAEVGNLIKEGRSMGDITRMIREKYKTLPGGFNRAATIARTEVGSAYNVSRYTEMKNFGVKKHQWLTSIDELTRDGSDPGEFNHVKYNGKTAIIGEPFLPGGMRYPMEDGFPAGDVINCRCETIEVWE